MREQPIEVVEHQRFDLPFSYRAAYEYCPQRGWKWLQRVCLWTLKKIGAHSMGMMPHFERKVIDRDKFVAKLYAQQRAVFDLMVNRPGTLLIGAEDFHEAMDQPEMKNIFQFSASVQMGRVDDRGQPHYSIMGMRVIVVPWMRGMVPIPDDLL